MKLRWFQFRLRTIFALFTLVAGASALLAGENCVVQERLAIEKWARAHPLGGPGYTGSHPPVSWIRRLLGDDGVQYLSVPAGVSQKQLDRIEAAFPEAEIIKLPYFGGSLSPLPAPMPGEPERPATYFYITRKSGSQK